MEPLRSRSIFETLMVRTTINPAQMREMVSFIALNRSFRLGQGEVRALVSGRSLAETAIGSVFTRAVQLHKEEVFGFLRIPPATSAPEVVTFNHVTFDLKQMVADDPTGGLSRVLATAPEFTNKIFYNVTPLLRQSGELTDTATFQAQIVRDLLVRSFYDTTTAVWLTPSLLRYLCRFYNMSMSATVGSVYNLTFKEQQAVATIFSLYFLQRVSNAETAEAMVKTNQLGLGAPDQILSVISRLRDVLGERYATMSLDDVCNGIIGLGQVRLGTINRRFLYTRQRNIGPDVMTSALALEYPPYWCYLVLLVLSGRKTALLSTFRNNDLTRGAPGFIDDLMKTQSFLPAI